MDFSFLLTVLLLGFWPTATSDDCSKYVLSTAFNIDFVNGKCLAVTKASFKGTSTTGCNSIGKGVTFEILSIDNDAENEKVKEGLLEYDDVTAYIGLSLTDTWSWSNGDPSGYRKWENPPVTQPPTPAITTTPIRTTYPPSKQRRSTAVVIGVDASLFSTNSLTFAQVEFVRRLSRYIGDRGPAEFAFFPYGCTQLTPFTLQYPKFVNTFEATGDMITNMNETINHDCTRMNPLDFNTMLRDQTLYYNRYSTSSRPFKSDFISMIYFSSSTDSDNIKSTRSLWPLANSSVITINVGAASIDISPYSIPSGKNGFRVQTADDIINLVPKVDAIIFGTSGIEENYQESYQENYQEEQSSNLISDATTVTDCAYMNSTDGLWYSDGDCTMKRPFLCQYIQPTPEPPPTLNPTIEWSDPCYSDSSGFTYFSSLQNGKCYRLSDDKKSFAQAVNACVTNHTLFLHEPQLTSVQSLAEESQLRALINARPGEGMFWFGLTRNGSSAPWYYVNGDKFEGFKNWRDGYPRDADGCDCVALVINDNSWVNTDCNKDLYSICSYHFDSKNT